MDSGYRFPGMSFSVQGSSAVNGFNGYVSDAKAAVMRMSAEHLIRLTAGPVMAAAHEVASAIQAGGAIAQAAA
jgi:hypothetical protein